MYTVKYAYTTLMNVVNAKHMSAFETFWKIKALPSVQTLALRVLLNRVQTKDNFYRWEKSWII